MTLFFKSFSLSSEMPDCYCLVPGFGSTSGASCVSVGPRLRRRPGRCRSGRCRTALSTGPGESPGSADTPSGNGTSIFQTSEKTFYFFLHLFVVEILMGNLSREESDISSQYGRSSPNTESASPELKNTVVRLNSPSFSSNFLTVSFARKQENISLRVLPSGQGT